MFVTFLLFESNLYLVLAREKGPKNSVHRDLFETKKPLAKSLQESADVVIFTEEILNGKFHFCAVKCQDP